MRLHRIHVLTRNSTEHPCGSHQLAPARWGWGKRALSLHQRALTHTAGEAARARHARAGAAAAR